MVSQSLWVNITLTMLVYKVRFFWSPPSPLSLTLCLPSLPRNSLSSDGKGMMETSHLWQEAGGRFSEDGCGRHLSMRIMVYHFYSYSFVFVVVLFKRVILVLLYRSWLSSLRFLVIQAVWGIGGFHFME